MGIVRGPEDGYVKEMARWEQRPVAINGTYVEPKPFDQGGRGWMPYAEHPKMLYRAESAMGGPRISGFKVVRSEDEELIAVGQGWSRTQEDAIRDVGRRELELATLAANRAHNDKWMSDKAKTEAQAADESTMAHLAAIPETPIVRRQPKEGK